MKKNQGATLLELVIGTSLLILVFFAGGSIYMTATNMFADGVSTAWAQRNAQIALMHIAKCAHESASEFKIENNGATVKFLVYNPSDITRPTITRSYDFDNIQNCIRYSPDVNSNSSCVIGTKIQTCKFSVQPGDGTVLMVEIAGLDENGQNYYSLSTRIDAGATASPSKYRVI